MSEQVQTREIDWEQLVNQTEQRPNKEPSYQFSNGKTFTEPFNPEGHGIYED